MYDGIIVGGGPAGMMAAITAATYGKRIALIEQNPELGRKMRLTGGGRCNITNNKTVHDFIDHLPTRNGRFLYHALQVFGPRQIMDYFTSRGVPLKVEDHDRVFPVSNRSLDLIMALERDLKSRRVDLFLATRVESISNTDSIKTIKTNRGPLLGKQLVIATGGQSYPHTGSTGFGYHWAHQQGIAVTPVYPAETPILASNAWVQSKDLQGLTFKDVILRLLDDKGAVIKQQRHDLIITHFGISGPAALMLSQFVYHDLKQHDTASLELDVFPDYPVDLLAQELLDHKRSYPQKTLLNGLDRYGPKRFMQVVLEEAAIPPHLPFAHLRKTQAQAIAHLLKHFSITAIGVKPLPYAFVTGGGIDLKEIDPKTMECKRKKGVFFVGEVLDLHGYTGGYNMTIALATGYIAGQAIGQSDSPY
ncbi:MAG TPA: NAD(P)/FAD-dependent oxidoreductase [Haloplasmataceae bacterium]